MSRHTRTTVVLGVAVVTAAIASAGVYRAVRSIPVREVEVAHKFVVLAARPIPLGARLEAADLKLVGWPSSSPLPGAFTRIEDAVGRGVVMPVSENEPVIEAKLAAVDAGAGVAPAIPPGMRAMAVKVNDVIGVAGYVVPGARVDVVATVRQPDDAVARVLVTNVQVLTAGTRTDQQQGHDGKPIPSTVVTLMVTPSQAERIALASAEGQVTLMLRNPLDLSEPQTPGVRLARLVDAAASPSEPAPVAPVAPHRRPDGPRIVVAGTTPAGGALREAVGTSGEAYMIEAIRAGKRTHETVK
jgi:pilus assembly protein CpaB